jgi:hypothetical protein
LVSTPSLRVALPQPPSKGWKKIGNEKTQKFCALESYFKEQRLETETSRDIIKYL